MPGRGANSHPNQTPWPPALQRHPYHPTSPLNHRYPCTLTATPALLRHSRESGNPGRCRGAGPTPSPINHRYPCTLTATPALLRNSRERGNPGRCRGAGRTPIPIKHHSPRAPTSSLSPNIPPQQSRYPCTLTATPALLRHSRESGNPGRCRGAGRTPIPIKHRSPRAPTSSLPPNLPPPPTVTPAKAGPRNGIGRGAYPFPIMCPQTRHDRPPFAYRAF